MRARVRQVILESIKMINYIREDTQQIVVCKSTVLFGENGCLDSMELVGLLIDIEEGLIECGMDVSLSDDRAMSQKNSPLRDMASLTNYIIGSVKK